jgi:hypothetical protein
MQVSFTKSYAAAKYARLLIFAPPPSKEDVKELKAYSKARTPVAKIAKAMKRIESALRRKAGIIGIGLGHDR